MHLMEKLWSFDGIFVEVSWRKILDWDMEKLWKIYGTFVEKQTWRNYGDLTHWKITD